MDKSKLDYRPTPTQRSTLELLRYMAVMGPTQIAVIQTGIIRSSPRWAPCGGQRKLELEDDDLRSGRRRHPKTIRRISHSILSGWTEADFRGDVDMFGSKSSRGALLVNLVLGGHAAYRTQLFCYLKACGRDELNTMNLWAGVDGPA